MEELNEVGGRGLAVPELVIEDGREGVRCEIGGVVFVKDVHSCGDETFSWFALERVGEVVASGDEICAEDGMYWWAS
jgi:hypothetical protein